MLLSINDCSAGHYVYLMNHRKTIPLNMLLSLNDCPAGRYVHLTDHRKPVDMLSSRIDFLTGQYGYFDRNTNLFAAGEPCHFYLTVGYD